MSASDGARSRGAYRSGSKKGKTDLLPQKKAPLLQIGTPTAVRSRLLNFNKNMRDLRDRQTEFATTRERIKQKKATGVLDEMNKHGLRQLIKEKATEKKGERETFKVTTMKDAKKLAKAAGTFDNQFLDRARYEHAMEEPMRWNLKKPSRAEVLVQGRSRAQRWAVEGPKVAEAVDRGSKRHSPETGIASMSPQNAAAARIASNARKYVSPFAEGKGSRATSMDSTHGRAPVEHAPLQIHETTLSDGWAYRRRHRTYSEESVNGPARSVSPTSSQFRTPMPSPDGQSPPFASPILRPTKSEPSTPKRQLLEKHSV
jgi:hypothetical protein